MKGVEARNYVNEYFCTIGSDLVSKLGLIGTRRPHEKTEVVNSIYLWDQDFEVKDGEKEM